MYMNIVVALHKSALPYLHTYQYILQAAPTDTYVLTYIICV